MVWSGCRAAAKTPDPRRRQDAPLAQKPGKQTAVFAGGCFWGTQSVFERVKGVLATTAGYAGGSASTATYDQVTTETTGHAESVRVVYDPSKITYGQLLRVFFSVAHDPTQLNRQGPDVGTSYRSAIFYTSDEQRRISLAYIAQLDAAARLSQADCDPGCPAEGLLRRRVLPSALRGQQSGQSLHPGLRPPQDRGAQAAVPRALSGLQGQVTFGLATGSNRDRPLEPSVLKSHGLSPAIRCRIPIHAGIALSPFWTESMRHSAGPQPRHCAGRPLPLVDRSVL